MLNRTQFKEYRCWKEKSYYSDCFLGSSKRSTWLRFTANVFGGSFNSSGRFDTSASIQFDEYDFLEQEDEWESEWEVYYEDEEG